MKGEHPSFNQRICMQCGICIGACPFGCIEISKTNYELLEVNNNCAGCGICMSACPVDAITLIKKEERQS